MATYGFKLAPFGLKPVSRKGSSQISPTVSVQYIDPVNTLSLGNGEVVQLSPIAVANYSNALPGYVNARLASTPASPTPAQELNAYGTVAGVYYRITQYPGEIYSTFWVQGTPIIPGSKVRVDVISDVEIEYEIQTNSVIGLQQSQIGSYCNIANINFIDGSANGADGINQGQSTAVLDLTTVSTTPTAVAPGNGGLFDVQIVGLSNRPRNFFGTNDVPQPYNYAIVKFNSFRQ